jgi:hypothetical protein
MKKEKIIYWSTTGIITAMMLFSAYGYFTNQEMKGAFVHLGFPGYFRIELGVMKILGALALILPLSYLPKQKAPYHQIQGFTLYIFRLIAINYFAIAY